MTNQSSSSGSGCANECLLKLLNCQGWPLWKIWCLRCFKTIVHREMQFSLHLWLLLFTFDYTGSNIFEDYEEMINGGHVKDERNLVLPVELGIDSHSGCICRATKNVKIIVCFGNYLCRRFPKVKVKSEILRVRTTVIVQIYKGALDNLNYLKQLDIEANYYLVHIQPGAFKNLSNLQHLSISYNTGLHTLDERLFEGLVNLRNLTLVNNGFTNVLDLTPAFRPSILPSLQSLDLSENSFEVISHNTFIPMVGTPLRKLDINLCRLDFIQQNSFLPLRKLTELNIGENDLNSTLIGNFLMRMEDEDIHLNHLDLSGMGFRKQPPRKLLDIIARTNIRKLILSHNQFESIQDETFPRMAHIELLDLRNVFAIHIGSNAFDPTKFPNLKVLLLGGNNLPGIHQKHLSNQLLVLDISHNRGNPIVPVYFEIDRDTFSQSREIKILNLAFNRIKAIFHYTFNGLENLKFLNLQNGTIFHIGAGTFKSTKNLEILNLGNNALTANENLTSLMFEGLNELKVLIMTNCGLRRFNDDDNIFEMMPNLTHLILKNNQLYYITSEMLEPLKNLQVLDLSENLLISWWKPLFLASGVKPRHLYLKNNKISHFSMSMIQDLNYLLDDNGTSTTDIDLMDNVFVCDCNAMYTTYLWLQVNGSMILKEYFASSHFQCSSPDLWEDRRVAEYLSSIQSLNCLMSVKMSNLMLFVWTAPSIVTVAIVIVMIAAFYKYRIYLKYWLFLAKMALGRKFIRKSLRAESIPVKGYKYDAFISYCYDDRNLVLEMITQLETNPPYLRLCVSERDFEIGAFISEAILSSINESRYVILLISNSFTKSQWCRWETQLAEYHRLFLEDGTSYDPLVLVRIGNVDNKYMTPTLKYLLKTKIYLTWDTQNSDVFWKKLSNILVRVK